MDGNPELLAEQAHLSRAYDRLEQLRADTRNRLRSALAQGTGTPQYLEERDVIVRTSLARLEQLDIGDQALLFGRIDRVDSGDNPAGATASAGIESSTAGIETFHIGRLGVSGDDLDPLVVDWRAPVAEPFYRATGRDPMGLVLRRHIAAEGRTVTDIEDERFSFPGDQLQDAVKNPSESSADAAGLTGASPGTSRAPLDSSASGAVLADELQVGGAGALLAALEGARTGRMRDIVSTIQGEQDAIIRSELPGVLVVQGGPGTGKTAVALHRAAYLLYTHRFPLERQGVLVIGPNPLFLRYIEKVLPSLGESGVTLSTISGLVHGFSVRGDDSPEVSRLKGDARMARVVTRAVRTRQHALRKTAEIPFGSTVLHLTPDLTNEVVSSARRRPGTHNARRRFVEQLVIRRLADEYQKSREVLNKSRSASLQRQEWREQLSLWGENATGGSGGTNGAGGTKGDRRPLDAGADPNARAEATARADANARAEAEADLDDTNLDDTGTDIESDEFDIADFTRSIRRVPELTEALDRIWPKLTAEELLHDLFGAPPLLALAAKGVLSQAEQRLLHRKRSATLQEVPFTAADAALVDEARVALGLRNPRRAGQDASNAPHGVQNPDEESARTYGHIVVDEAQDLSPMQLRMVSRRSLSGSITVVGDIGQATGPWAADRWDGVTGHLPKQRPARMVELSVSYRTPAEVMEVAARVLVEAAPALKPPTAIRRTGAPPTFVRTDPEDLAAEVAAVAADLSAQLQPGTVAVLSPASLVAEIALALDAAGVRAHDPRLDGLGSPVSLLPVDLANGLEFDGVIVVEPAAVVEESPNGLRRLYVALTRPTRRLAILHARPLPESLLSRDSVSARD